MVEGQSMIQLAASRQAVAEWRDRHIVAAGSLINFRAVEALKALELELRDVSGIDSMLNPTRLAHQRIDALMSAALAADIPILVSTAAEELAAIDGGLFALSIAFAQTDVVLPSEAVALSLDADVVTVLEPALVPDPVGDEPVLEHRLAGLGRRLQKGVAALSQSAGTAADVLLNDHLGMINRVRSAASLRVRAAWMDEVEDPETVLHQLIFAVDGAAQEARIQLS